MATEGAASWRTRVVGMVCSLWALILGPLVLALEGKKERGRRCPAASRAWGSGQEEDPKSQKRVKALRRGAWGSQRTCMGCFRDSFLAAAELFLASEMDQGGTFFESSQGWSDCCRHYVFLAVWAEVLG